MSQMTIERVIDAPPADVFSRASDFEHGADVIGAIRHVEMLTGGATQVGTRFRETRVVFNREATEELEVTEFDPPRSYVLAARSCGCRFRIQMRFSPAGQGTKVQMQFESVPLTMSARVMSWFMWPLMKKMARECARDLDDLASTFASASPKA